MPERPSGAMSVGSGEYAERLLEEKLDALRGQIGAAERDQHAVHLKIDELREEVETLEASRATLQRAIEQLTNTQTNGLAEVEQQRAKLVKAMEDAETKAHQRINAATTAEQAALKAHQTAQQLLGLVRAAKADVVAALDELGADLRTLTDNVRKALDTIR